MQFYSQEGQDRFVYENFFKNRTVPGIFVDVGAYDGVTFSNTLFFERYLGWRGVCVEPLPTAFEKLKAVRSAVCLNCAISDRAGTAAFLDIDMPRGFEKMFSGLKANFDERHRRVINKSKGRIAREIQVDVRRLSDILSENSVSRIDYLTIDTEGSEWRILRDFDLSAYGISVISVENPYDNEKLRKHIKGQGFRLVHSFGGYDELYVKINSN
jgi:FkbM family methyltransferase